MKIIEIQSDRFPIHLKKTFKTALRTVDQYDNLVVKIKTDNGLEGIGGASPTAVITGDTMGSIQDAVEHIAQSIVGLDLENTELIFQKLHRCIIGNTSAKAAVDMAIYDLQAKLYKVPLYQMLGGARKQLTTNFTISIDTVEKMVGESREMVKQGFNTLKTKVGGEVEVDLVRLKAIRDAVGKEVKIRVDANQGWKPKEAVSVINRLQKEGVDLELVEQPVHCTDIDGMRFVRDHVEVPVFADESAFSPRDVLKLIQTEAVDGINIKLMKCGGIYAALKIAAMLETAGIECMIGTMMESPIGVTAAAHLAAAKSIVTYVDLDAPLFCRNNPVVGGVVYQGPQVSLPKLPGLGIETVKDLFSS